MFSYYIFLANKQTATNNQNTDSRDRTNFIKKKTSKSDCPNICVKEINIFFYYLGYLDFKGIKNGLDQCPSRRKQFTFVLNVYENVGLSYLEDDSS